MQCPANLQSICSNTQKKWMFSGCYLVGGIPTPLKNDGLRQLRWSHSQYDGKNNPNVPNHQPAIDDVFPQFFQVFNFSTTLWRLLKNTDSQIGKSLWCWHISDWTSVICLMKMIIAEQVVSHGELGNPTRNRNLNGQIMKLTQRCVVAMLPMKRAKGGFARLTGSDWFHHQNHHFGWVNHHVYPLEMDHVRYAK